LTEVFAPVINRDPIVALRLGVTPQVDEFLASLRDKDAPTRGHVIRVAELAMTLGMRAGFKADRLRTLGLAALMHDIGKIRVDHAILTKNGPLTDAEYDEIKLHTVIGERMLSGDEMLRPASRLVRSHHERVDGTGYPDGLGGSDVGLDIGIIAVSDAWDAMVQTRHYRAGMSEADARRILVDGAGTQWPAAAVELLLAELDDGWELRGVFAGVGWTDADQVVCADTLVGLV
jgi:HD-GYP domain-containing protein (c-di-GMP phosphodiesterase class II)